MQIRLQYYFPEKMSIRENIEQTTLKGISSVLEDVIASEKNVPPSEQYETSPTLFQIGSRGPIFSTKRDEIFPTQKMSAFRQLLQSFLRTVRFTCQVQMKFFTKFPKSTRAFFQYFKIFEWKNSSGKDRKT